MFLRFVLLISFLAMLSACSEEEGLPRGNGDGSDGSNNEVGTIELGETAAVAQIPFSYQIPEADTLIKPSFSIKQLPAWADIDSKTGEIFGTPSAADITAYAPVELEIKGTLASSPEKTKTITFSGHLSVHHTSAILKNKRTDFYHMPFNSEPRQYRNDLTGDLAGEVQFIQSHAVAPLHEQNVAPDSGDETQSVYRSDVVAKREALVLFFPTNASDLITLDVDVLINGEPVQTLGMNHPNTLPSADNPTELDIAYSTRAWWIKLPYEHVTTGLSLTFVANKGAASETSGNLAQVDISPVNRMVVTSIRVGMLTEPQRSGGHATLRDPIATVTDYFQTLPVSELIFASYADVHFPRVMIANGTVYDQDSSDEAHNHSQSEGGAYGGDMRENVGKAQISTGINMANMGITSWRMNQNYPQPFKQTTAHHACGLYTNGVQCHGLSGGNGIATLYNSTGNEFSHELGHGFSAYTFTPDYYGDNKAAPVSDFIASAGHWGTHNPTSGYGYMMQHHKLRSGITSGLNSEGKPSFKHNAMSGGDPQSPLSNYTYYTGFMALNIQRDLNQYVVPTPKSEFASGYKVWDSNIGQWQAAHPTCDNAACPAATEVGVPVTTLLGAYQPPKRSDRPNEYVQYDNWTKNTDSDKAVIYPALHGNYGNVFDLPAPNLNDGQDHCWLAVSNSQETKNIELSATRALNDSAANQFHVNLPASFKPTQAELYCQQAGESAVLLTRTELDGLAPVFDGVEKHSIDGSSVYPPLARVGFNTQPDDNYHGIAQFVAREMQAIENALANTAPQNLSSALQLMINSYSDEELEQGLSSNAWQVLSEYRLQQQKINAVAALIAYGKALELSAQERKQQLINYLLENNLAENEAELVVEGAPIYGRSGPYAAPNTAYMSTELDSNSRVQALDDVENANQHLWVMDAQGRIHLAEQPNVCLAGTNPLSLQACDNNAANHFWHYDTESYPDFPQLKASNGQCADINSGYAPNIIGLYTCGANKANQAWYGIAQHQALWLALADANTLKAIFETLK